MDYHPFPIVHHVHNVRTHDSNGDTMTTRTENLLLEDCQELGYEGVRVDIRGGAGYTSGHDAGDVIVGKPDPGMLSIDETLSELYIIEEKYSTSETNKYIYIYTDQIDPMIAFARDIGATPLVAVRWSNRLDHSPGATHLIADAREIERTKSNNMSISPEQAESEFVTPMEYFSDAKVSQ